MAIYIAWTVVTLIGVLISYITWTDSWHKMRIVSSQALGDEARTLALGNFRSQSFILVVLIIFSIIGLVFLTTEPPPNRPEWARLTLIVGLMLSAILLTTNALFNWIDSRRFNRLVEIIKENGHGA